MPDVAAAESAGKVAVLPGMIKMEAGIVATVVVPDPFAVAVNVWSFGMAFAVAKVGMLRSLMRRSVESWGTMAGNESAADLVVLG